MSVEIVKAIKAALEVRGVNLTGPCGALEITSRVAWAKRHDGFGLVHKEPHQNGCSTRHGRFAIDALMLKDGQTFDILISGGGEEDKLGVPIPGTGNGPAWQIVKPQPPGNWRAPFDPDAGFVSDPPERPTDPIDDEPPDASPPTQAEMAIAVTLLAKEVQRLSDDLRVKGLTGKFLGYAVKLTIPDVK